MVIPLSHLMFLQGQYMFLFSLIHLHNVQHGIFACNLVGTCLLLSTGRLNFCIGIYSSLLDTFSESFSLTSSFILIGLLTSGVCLFDELYQPFVLWLLLLFCL